MSQLAKYQDICANNDQINQSNSQVTSQLICNGNSVLSLSTDSLNLIVKYSTENQSSIKLAVNKQLSGVMQLVETLDQKHSIQTYITKIAKYLMTTSDSITHQLLLKKIPTKDNYYRTLYEKLPSEKINELFSNLNIFEYVVEKTYQIVWQKQLEPNLKTQIMSHAQTRIKGFQRVSILLVYLPEENNIRQTIFKKLQNYLTIELLKNQFFQNLIQLGYRERNKQQKQSFNPQNLDLSDSQDDRVSYKSQCTYGQQAQKQNSNFALQRNMKKLEVCIEVCMENQKLSFIGQICNLIETVYRANLKIDLVASAFTKKKMLQLINSYISTNAKQNRQNLMKILLFIVKINPLQLWRACQQQQLQNFLADILTMPTEISRNTQQITKQENEYYYRVNETYHNGLQFLLQMSQIKQAKYMIMRVVEYLLENKFDSNQIEFLIALLPKNKAIVEYFGASFICRIEQLIQSKTRYSRVLFCNIVSLLKSMMQSLYNFQMQQFSNIIRKLQQKGGILKNCINGIKRFVRDKLAVVEQDELRDYFYNFFNKLEIQQQ